MSKARLAHDRDRIGGRMDGVVLRWPSRSRRRRRRWRTPGNGRRSSTVPLRQRMPSRPFPSSTTASPRRSCLDSGTGSDAVADSTTSAAERTTTWTDPKTGLEVRCVSVEYSDFPVVEWTVYFKNAGKAATPILADMQGMNVSFRRDGDGGYHPAQHARRRLLGRQLSASRLSARQGDEPSVRPGRRAADQRDRDALFQRGMAGPRRDRRARLAGAMGGPVRLRQIRRC